MKSFRGDDREMPLSPPGPGRQPARSTVPGEIGTAGDDEAAEQANGIRQRRDEADSSQPGPGSLIGYTPPWQKPREKPAGEVLDEFSIPSEITRVAHLLHHALERDKNIDCAREALQGWCGRGSTGRPGGGDSSASPSDGHTPHRGSPDKR
ncbi:hypothetical protein GCM10009634_76240 [Saccharothrix xinjiangensis]